MNKIEAKLRWKELFVGKHINGIKIKNIEIIGPPSYGYGSVEITMENDKTFFAPGLMEQYKPKIRDMKKIVDEYQEKEEA